MESRRRCSFRLADQSYPAYLALKEWCRVNRVPMGRMLNAALEAMQELPPYATRQAVVIIPYPKQTNIDDRLRYLTRVSKYEQDLRRRSNRAVEA